MIPKVSRRRTFESHFLAVSLNSSPRFTSQEGQWWGISPFETPWWSPCVWCITMKSHSALFLIDQHGLMTYLAFSELWGEEWIKNHYKNKRIRVLRSISNFNYIFKTDWMSIYGTIQFYCDKIKTLANWSMQCYSFWFWFGQNCSLGLERRDSRTNPSLT